MFIALFFIEMFFDVWYTKIEYLYIDLYGEIYEKCNYYRCRPCGTYCGV